MKQSHADGVKVLAWYHSHPSFRVDPSNMDLQTHSMFQQSFKQDNIPFFGVIIGPYHKQQEVQQTQMNVFNLRDERFPTMQKHRQVRARPQDRARSYQYRIIPQKTLRYMMYVSIKWMIKFSSTHKCDQIDFEQEWTSKRQRNRHTFKEKCIFSLKKICDDNLHKFGDESITELIKSDFISDGERNKFDEQLKESIGKYVISQEGVTMNDVLDDENGSQFHGHNTLDGLNQNKIFDENQRIEAALHQELRKKMQQHTGNKNFNLESPQFKDQNCHQQKYLSFFSIGDPMKICKFILKIEQALVKYYGMRNGSVMQRTYEDTEKQKTQHPMEIGTQQQQQQAMLIPPSNQTQSIPTDYLLKTVKQHPQYHQNLDFSSLQDASQSFDVVNAAAEFGTQNQFQSQEHHNQLIGGHPTNLTQQQQQQVTAKSQLNKGSFNYHSNLISTQNPERQEPTSKKPLPQQEINVELIEDDLIDDDFDEDDEEEPPSPDDDESSNYQSPKARH